MSSNLFCGVEVLLHKRWRHDKAAADISEPFAGGAIDGEFFRRVKKAKPTEISHGVGIF